jgi:aldehyde dehydrogenase (NAD+)
VLVISAFNFPVAVWAWNTCLAIVCGDPVIWKPSEKTPLTALATQAVFDRAIARFGDAPEGLSQLVIGGREAGEALAADPRVALVSATGSTRMGRAVAQTVAARLGRSLLELGGNNAMIVTPSADLDLAVRAIAFSAVGTCGQRCTSLRRLLVHESIADGLIARLKPAYETLPVGDPRQDGVLVGPLIDEASALGFESALAQAVEQGGEIVVGGDRVDREGVYVRPAIVRMPKGVSGQTAVVEQETFAPILYVMTWSDFDAAIAMQNAVPQGLSSCVFTDSVREAETFLSAWGSDCGIANVNIGPSGAEIGGAFGGEKDTGGGRESGSDAWKSYMRRQTQTVNFSRDLPLAQGVKFDV